ncbi:erythromycin esterase family protein [Paenibacillus sp. CN-4]|uniref:erythromycin esterase family protein n=1 Tax=Paenibacillus nanchangensis TaxID=3348343 RepID=UPI00397CBF44
MDEQKILEEIRRLSRPFAQEPAGMLLAAKTEQAKVVLLGEASHGTSEFYTVRAELTKRLIQEGNIRFIAVEGDWPACYTLNQYVMGQSDAGAAEEALRSFRRWPTWMWANREIEAMAEWLREYNADKAEREKVGFYGIDLYSLWESMDEIIGYLEERGGADLEAAKAAFECFEPYNRDEQTYGIAASFLGEGCVAETDELLQRLTERRRNASDEEKEGTLNAEMNAEALAGAEAYYRTMVRHDTESWNVRDRHMVKALQKLLDHYGPAARAVVWEHNTHIGDARATDMALEGMVNVGQLLREQYGSQVYAVGFGTYEGTVIAGSAWGAPAEVMPVPPAIKGSWEELVHRTGAEDKLILFENWGPALSGSLGHRAIGVVYHPGRERGNYVPTVLPERYDAFIYLDRTHALTPLGVRPSVYDEGGQW